MLERVEGQRLPAPLGQGGLDGPLRPVPGSDGPHRVPFARGTVLRDSALLAGGVSQDASRVKVIESFVELGPGAKLVRDVGRLLVDHPHEGNDQVHIFGDAPLVVEARLGELRWHGGLPLAVLEVGVVVALERVREDDVGGLARTAAGHVHELDRCAKIKDSIK